MLGSVPRTVACARLYEDVNARGPLSRVESTNRDVIMRDREGQRRLIKGDGSVIACDRCEDGRCRCVISFRGGFLFWLAAGT